MDNQNQFTPPLGQVPQFQSAEQIKPKMKLWKKLLLVLLVLIFLAGVSIYNLPRILTILYPNDAVLVDNSELLLKKVNIPDEDNGFFDLNKIKEEMIKLPEIKEGNFLAVYTDFSKPVAWDQKLVDQVLNDNKEVLNLFDQAVNKNYTQVPQYADPAKIDIEAEIPKMNIWKLAAQLQSLKAKNLAIKGKPDQAIEEALKINKLGYEIISGNNSIIGTLVGIVIKNLGANTGIYITSNYNIKNDVLTNEISKLESVNNNIEGYKNAFKFEYNNLVNGIDVVGNKLNEIRESLISSENMPSDKISFAKYNYYYKINQTKNLYTDLYKRQLYLVGSKCSADEIEKELSLSKKEFLDKNKYQLIFTENLAGELMFTTSGPFPGTVVTKQCQSDLLSNIAIIELALKAYQNDNKKLPQKLDELVPKYLESIPKDPFDHKPIRYSQEKKILYSVGLKQKDLGGSIGDDWTKMENPTFKIAF